MEDHFRKLERMYRHAPVQDIYKGIELNVAKGKAEIRLPVDPKFFHAGNSLHGSVYFRLLDDAAYFAANSLVFDAFLMTSSFHIDFHRPVTGGILTSKGNVLKGSTNLFLAESKLYDDRERLVASGKGTFMKSNFNLTEALGYEKDI